MRVGRTGMMMPAPEEISVVATGLGFPEAPVAMEDGSVLVAEVRAGLVTRVTAEGQLETYADCGGGPCGLAFGPDGMLYVCNNGGNAYRPGSFISVGRAAGNNGGYIQRVDPVQRTVSTLYTHCGDHALSAPNDICFDQYGGFYFTDIGARHARSRDNGALYYGAPDGSGVREVAYNVAAANGVGLSPDGSVVYVAETETGRLWAFDIEEPGVVKKLPFPSPHGGRFICGLPGFQRFDSLALDAQGNICVATLMSGCVTVVSPSGEVLRQVKLPDQYVTNICFGGPELRTAYVTLAETGRIVSMPWEGQGLKLHFGPATCKPRTAVE